jgi:hypothetical protein
VQDFVDHRLAGHSGYLYKCKIDNNNILTRISKRYIAIERQKENSVSV